MYIPTRVSTYRTIQYRIERYSPQKKIVQGELSLACLSDPTTVTRR